MVVVRMTTRWVIGIRTDLGVPSGGGRTAPRPVIILNLQPTVAIDYATFNALGDRIPMTGEWLAHCSACPVPEIANVFRRADGPRHTKIAQGRMKIQPLNAFHGKVGSGVSVEMSVHQGPVTLLSIVEDAGTIKLLCTEGASVAGPILEIGNTNSRYRFPLGARRFVEAWNAQGPAQHCAVGVGHIAGRIEKLGKLLDLAVVKVC
nr:hypothetical protein [Rhizobium leguminosarum]